MYIYLCIVLFGQEMFFLVDLATPVFIFFDSLTNGQINGVDYVNCCHCQLDYVDDVTIVCLFFFFYFLFQ